MTPVLDEREIGQFLEQYLFPWVQWGWRALLGFIGIDRIYFLLGHVRRSFPRIFSPFTILARGGSKNRFGLLVHLLISIKWTNTRLERQNQGLGWFQGNEMPRLDLSLTSNTTYNLTPKEICLSFYFGSESATNYLNEGPRTYWQAPFQGLAIEYIHVQYLCPMGPHHFPHESKSPTFEARAKKEVDKKQCSSRIGQGERRGGNWNLFRQHGRQRQWSWMPLSVGTIFFLLVSPIANLLSWYWGFGSNLYLASLRAFDVLTCDSNLL